MERVGFWRYLRLVVAESWTGTKRNVVGHLTDVAIAFVGAIVLFRTTGQRSSLPQIRSFALAGIAFWVILELLYTFFVGGWRVYLKREAPVEGDELRAVRQEMRALKGRSLSEEQQTAIRRAVIHDLPDLDSRRERPLWVIAVGADRETRRYAEEFEALLKELGFNVFYGLWGLDLPLTRKYLLGLHIRGFDTRSPSTDAVLAHALIDAGVRFKTANPDDDDPKPNPHLTEDASSLMALRFSIKVRTTELLVGEN